LKFERSSSSARRSGALARRHGLQLHEYDAHTILVYAELPH
jgi:hypothetical protein